MSLSTTGPIESIGATVRFWREQRGWTRTRLAAEARIPLPTISDIEAGWEGATAFHLKRIWGALGVYHAWIVCPAEWKTSTAPPATRAPASPPASTESWQEPNDQPR